MDSAPFVSFGGRHPLRDTVDGAPTGEGLRESVTPRVPDTSLLAPDGVLGPLIPKSWDKLSCPYFSFP